MSVLDTTWDTTSLGDGYAEGGAIVYNNGPALQEITLSADILDETGTPVGSETSGLYGRVPPYSFAIVPITSTSSPPNTQIKVVDVATEPADYDALAAGAILTAQAPNASSGQIPVTVVNKEKVAGLTTASYVDLAFLDSDDQLLGIGQTVLVRDVNPGETVKQFLSTSFVEVPSATATVLATAEFGLS